MINTAFKKYAAYKDSGVDWLGDVPAHWEVRRMKDYVAVSPPSIIPNSLSNGKLVEFVPMTNVDEGLGRIKQFDFVPLQDVASGYTRFQNDDVIFAKITPCMENGNCAVVRDLKHNIGFGSTEFFVFRPHRFLLPVYLHYFLHNELFRRNAEPFMKGSAGQKRVPRLYMSIHTFPCPPLNEQRAIADYLDEKTGQIDRKIDLLTQKAEQYKQLKQSLINETVTRGLDKTAPMQDSGIDWLGEIPAHWEIKRIGSVFEERREKVNDIEYPPLSVTMNGIVPQLDTAAKTNANDNRKRVAVNDFVINSRSDRRGSSGLSSLEGSVSQISIVLTPHREIYGRFFHFLFRSYRFTEEFYRMGRGIVDDLWTTRWAVMKTIEVAVPEYEDQKAIADYLDTKSAHIDRIFQTINCQIATLQELRRTLINDVVTGKIKVID